jgi:heme oxygenase
MDSSNRLQATTGAAEPILPRLKRDTQAGHAGLESRIDLMNRVKTAADYRRLLEAFYGLVSPMEARMGRHTELAAWLPDIEDRMRSGALCRDLHVLGNTSPRDLPVAAVPEYASVAERMGCLYVLEGSTLGGQVISRYIKQTLGFTPEHGCGFFYGRGTATGAMWQRFRHGIESYASARPLEHSAAIQSALRTFQTFDAWMGLRL